MVYDYDTTQEFIEDSDKLLKKLEKAGLWSKDTLVIGLDKSVRPLAYTLRKLSQVRNTQTPDMRFFNYSIYDDNLKDYVLDQRNKGIAEHMKRQLPPEKLKQYKKVLILDESACSGESLRTMKEILEIYFGRNKEISNIHFAALNVVNSGMQEITHFVGERYIGRRTSAESGIKDAYSESQRVQDKEIYREFIKNRKQLSKDIKDYLQEQQGDEEKSITGRTLERAVQTASIIALFGGFIFGYKGITGNVIGVSSSSNILSTILIIFGIVGLVFSRKSKF